MPWGTGDQWQPPEMKKTWGHKQYRATVGVHGGVNFCTVYGNNQPVIRFSESGVSDYNRIQDLNVLTKVHLIREKYKVSKAFGNPVPSIDVETIVDFLSTLGFDQKALNEIRRAFDENERREVQKMQASLR